jgi:murein DD-endopeptidase MepM/ murein hydrolase activator NlpD
VTLIERMLIAVVLAASLVLSRGMPPPAAAGADHVGNGSSPSGVEAQLPTPGSYAWPVVGPVIRGFIAPPNQFGAGHRGIDIAVPFGSPVHASNDGVVSFAGWVGGALYVSIDHADGVRTTYSWLSSVAVSKGESVGRGDVIGASGHGHPQIPTPHLHFGARIGDVYIDPMILLGTGDVSGFIHLAPL